MDSYQLGYETMPQPDNGRSVDVVPPSPATAGQDWLTTARVGSVDPDTAPDLAAQEARDDRLYETIGSSFQAASYDATSTGNDLALADAIDARNQAVFQATGEQLENPMRGGYAAPALTRLQAGRTAPAPYAGPTAALAVAGDQADAQNTLRGYQLDAYQAALADVARKHPDKPGLASSIITARNDLITGAEARAERAVAADGLRGRLVGFVAGAASAVRDPMQMLALGIPGAGELRAASLLGRVMESGLRHAAVNAGVQAAMEPALQKNRAERGVEHGFGPALTDIGGAAAFGGALGVGHGLVHAFLGKHGLARQHEGAARGEVAAVDQVLNRVPREDAPVAHAAALDHALDRAVMEHRPSRADPEALSQAVRDGIRFGEGIGPLPEIVPDVDDPLGRRLAPSPELEAALRVSSVPPEAAAHIPLMFPDPIDQKPALDALEVAGAATPEEARAVLSDEALVASHPAAVEAILGPDVDEAVSIEALGGDLAREARGTRSEPADDLYLEERAIGADERAQMTELLRSLAPESDNPGVREWAQRPDEGSVESVWAHSVRSFDIRHEGSEAPIGQARITESEDRKRLNVEWIGRQSWDESRGRLGDFAQTLGTRAMLSLLKDLRAKYPDAETIGGHRISGARHGTARPSEGVIESLASMLSTERNDALVRLPPAARASDRPQTLLAFLRAAGGLKDDGGELRARDLHRAYPGLVNNRAGLPLDRAREMAAEAGYLGADTERAVAETRIDDLLQAIDSHPVYSVHDEGRLASRAEAARRRQWLRHTKAARGEIDGFAQEHGLDVDPELRAAAAERMVAHGEGIEDALRNVHLEEPNVHDDTAQLPPAELDSLSRPGESLSGGGGEARAGEREPAETGALREAQPHAGEDGGRAGSEDDGRDAIFDVRPSRDRADFLDLTPLADRDDGGDTVYGHAADLAEGETPEEQLARLTRECPF